MSVQLTREADALICVLYKKYCKKRKNGIPKGEAKNFGSSANVYKNIKTKLQYKDIDDTCSELKRTGLLNCTYADDIVYTSSLSDKGIAYMENRFKNGFKEFLEYLDKIKNIIHI